MTSRGVCRLSFLDEHDFDWHCKELAAAFPAAHIVRDKHGTKAIVSAIDVISSRSNVPITLHVMGTNFQIKVWQALLNIPEAQLRSYSHVAESIGAPKAVRAVASAVAANPVALLIPCHRVIRQSGEIGGYHWGATRKRAIQAWELARAEG